MGRYQRTSTTLRLFDLLFLASAASAVSLSSFKLISSNGLPLACVIAYNTPISGCTNNDFTTGNTCSSTCIAGIETTQALINSACDQVDPGDNTILILAMNGRLVDALCPNNGDNNNDGDNGDKTTTTARVTTSSARTTTTSIGRFTTIPSRSTSSTSSTSSTPFAADPAQSESTTKSTSTTPKSTSTTSLSVTTGDVLTVTNTASPSRSTTSTSSKAAKETDPLDNGGGGSPFDASDSFAAKSSAATPCYQVQWWPATLAAVFAAGCVLAH